MQQPQEQGAMAEMSIATGDQADVVNEIDEECSVAHPQAAKHVARALETAVNGAVNRAVNALFEKYPCDDEAKLIQFEPSTRLANKIYEAVKSSIEMHGIRAPLVGNKEAQIPYLAELEEVSPGLATRIRDGDVDLIDLANGSYVGTKQVPSYLVESLLQPPSDVAQGSVNSTCSANMLIPYNKLLPYSAKSLNAAHWRCNVKNITGDRARGMPAQDFWQALSPPHGITHAGESGQDMDVARFSLPTAMMVMRKHGTLPRAHTLDETFYYEHPTNTLGASGSRFNFSGPGFVGAKHVAEIFNGIVQTVHKHPPSGTDAHDRVQRHLFTEKDVAATIAALSLALQHGGDKAAQQAELFYVNADTPPDSKEEKTHLLKRPVCHLKTEQDKAAALDLLAAFQDEPFEGGKQGRAEQKTRQITSDILRVDSGYRFQWGHAKDQVLKHRFVEAKEPARMPPRASPKPAQGARTKWNPRGGKGGASWRTR